MSSEIDILECKRPRREFPECPLSSSPDCLKLILRCVDAKSLATAACVSSAWRKAATSDALWQRLCGHEYRCTRSLTAALAIAQGEGFYRFYRHRLLPPSSGATPGFSWNHLTFYLDVVYKGKPLVSHYFRCLETAESQPYNKGSFVDESANLPHAEGLMTDALRKSIQVNLSVVRSTDYKAVCILRSVADRCGPGTKVEGSCPGESFNEREVERMLEAKKVGVDMGVQEKQTLKLVYNRNLGGHVGRLFYGMVTIELLLSLQHKWVPTGELVPGVKDKMYFESAHRMSKAGGFSLSLSALKDRLGGTVRVQLSTEEFVALLAGLVWQ